MPEIRPDPPVAAKAGAVRWFGRLQLLRLLGKSRTTMAWRAVDPATGHELLLTLPRQQPADAAALDRWRQSVHPASRLNHPHLAAVVQVGVQDGWPFVAYQADGSATLPERATAHGLPGAEAAALAAQLLQALAYAHDAGIAHRDLQPFHVLVTDAGQVRLAGLSVALAAPGATDAASGATSSGSAAAAGGLRAQREAAERDVLAAGIVLHQLIGGADALDEPDCALVIERLPPLGRESLRLPWTTAHPIAEPLRAIVNRATDRQERQRYRSARTLLRALEGWLQTDSGAGSGPLALLADRLRTVGALPASPGSAARAARLALMEQQRTNELAEVVLDDVALSFELLRLVNSARVRGMQAAGSGPVLTVRRAIAMLGLDGVRRSALALRTWPGPLAPDAATALERLLERCRFAGRVALALRPAAYDPEVVLLITLLQNLGRLIVHYHFADEAQQIRRLMQPGASPRPGDPEDPGMTEEQASFAVLGADVEAIGAAVARWWGFDDSVLTLVRRLPLNTPVRTAADDDEMLRTLASCANEAVDALALPSVRVQAALQQVVHRYGRALEIGTRELHDALGDRALMLPDPGSAGLAGARDGRAGAGDVTAAEGAPSPGALRASAAQRATTPR